jgi:TPR repeat protein
MLYRQPDRSAHRAQETDWSDLDSVRREWSAAPGRIPETAAAPGRAQRLHAEADPFGYDGHLNEVLDNAGAGDAASEAYRNGLRAMSQGDVAAALGYYEKAAQLGLVDAMYDAGCVNSDLGRTSVSTYWWEEAARRGHAQSAYNLGVLALRAGDLNAARPWYQKAAELGDGGGYAALTQMAAETGDKQAEMHWSRQGAELGHPFCLMRYGQLLMQASPNDRTVMEQALVLEERAAQTGEAEAMFLAGIINGQLGRRSEARWWLEQAERAGNPRARSVIDRYGF